MKNIGDAHRLILVGAAVVMGLFCGGAQAEASDLRAGVATVDITPDLPIMLSGYSARTEEAEEVEHPIYAKALAIEDNGQLSVLITVELIGVSDWLTEEVAEQLADAGVERPQLAIAATHTHSAPVVWREFPPRFADVLSDDARERVTQYVDALPGKLTEAARAALDDLDEAELAWGQGSVDFAANRRVIEDGQWAGWGHVREAPADHDMPVLAVRNPAGELRAVLVNYACHCTTLPAEFNAIHGDWAGEAAARIEDEHEGAVALIAIGCGADANPYPSSGMDYVEQHGQTIAEETAKVLENIMTPLSEGPAGSIREVTLPFADGENELDYAIQLWAFGDELAMLFLPGEVTSEYALRLKRELDRHRLWVNAYANDAPCYISCARVIEEGGYEAVESMANYGQPGPLDPKVEDIIIEAAHEMLTPTFSKPEREPAELKEGNEPRLVTADEDGVLRLTADAGQPYGPRIEYMPEPVWEAFGWWTADDHVEWEVEAPETGEYDVWMEWSVAPHTAGHPYVFLAGDRVLRGYTESTNEWETFKRAKIGQIYIPEGRLTMALKPAADVVEALLDLREIRLIPAEER